MRVDAPGEFVVGAILNDRSVIVSFNQELDDLLRVADQITLKTTILAFAMPFPHERRNKIMQAEHLCRDFAR